MISLSFTIYIFIEGDRSMLFHNFLHVHQLNRNKAEWFTWTRNSLVWLAWHCFVFTLCLELNLDSFLTRLLNCVRRFVLVLIDGSTSVSPGWLALSTWTVCRRHIVVLRSRWRASFDSRWRRVVPCHSSWRFVLQARFFYVFQVD